MLFRNKKTNEQKRTRQPDIKGVSSSTPVFSYHARSVRTDKTSVRKASFLGLGGDKPDTPRPKPKRWRQRGIVVAATVLFLALAVLNLTINTDPEVVMLADTGQRQMLLRSEDAYHQAAQAILGSSVANTNKFTLDTTHIAEEMRKQFTELDDVTVTLPVIGRRPTVYIQPAQPALLVRTPRGEVFVVDTNGRALMSASQVAKAERLGLTVAEDQSGLTITPGQNVLPSGNVSFITEVVGQLKAKKLKIAALILPTAANELDLKLEGQPYTVKFNLRGDAREEAGAFLAVKQYLERQGKKPGSYIDVRVDNKAYYR